MSRRQPRAGRLAGRSALMFCALLSVLCLGPGPSDSLATVPVGGPNAFSNPLEITNPYFPVVPGTVKVYIGRENGRTITVLENHLEEIREFEWQGQMVPCRTVERMKFESGELLEQENTWYAQDDEGGVHVWGDIDLIDDPDDEDEEESESSGWVVGLRKETDPPDVLDGQEPALVMPAIPEEGDAWEPERTPPYFLAMHTVEAVGRRVRTPAGRFEGCLRIREEDLEDGSGETLWFAPEKGLVKVVGPGERLRLHASNTPER